jgi:hypothetical protein
MRVSEAEVAALRAERMRLQATVGSLRGIIAIMEGEANPPRPLPDLQTYGYDVGDVVEAIRRRGIHPSEFLWLADFIEALAKYDERAR